MFDSGQAPIRADWESWDEYIEIHDAIAAERNLQWADPFARTLDMHVISNGSNGAALVGASTAQE